MGVTLDFVSHRSFLAKWSNATTTPLFGLRADTLLERHYARDFDLQHHFDK